MELNNVEMSSDELVAKSSQGPSIDGKTRVQQFLARVGFIVHIGRILSFAPDKQTRLSAIVARPVGTDNAVKLGTALTINKVKFELNGGQALAIHNLGEWGCMTCPGHAVHGSGVGSSARGAASKEPNASLLDINEFYYDPAGKRVFSISTTCKDKYWKGQESRILTPAQYAERVKAQTPTVVSPAAAKPTVKVGKN